MNEKIQIKSDFPRTREALSQMLNELSDEALEYVCRPIWYAYMWTDEHDTDALTEDDVLCLQLIGATVHDTPETIEILWAINNYLFHEKLKKEAQS